MTAWTRSRSWSLARSLATWVLTVASLRVSCAASLGVAQAAGEQPQHVEFPGGEMGQVAAHQRGSEVWKANRSTSLRVMDGASSASPERTMRMAAMRYSGDTCLSRKPLAPAASAP